MKEKKNLTYRLVVCFFFVLAMALAAYFLYDSFLMKNDGAESTLALVSEVILILALFYESATLLSRPKKELLLQDIAFERDGELNKLPLIVLNVILLLGLALLGGGLYLYFVSKRGEGLANAEFLLACGVALSLNMLAYDLYVAMYRPHPFKVEDLLK